MRRVSVQPGQSQELHMVWGFRAKQIPSIGCTAQLDDADTWNFLDYGPVIKPYGGEIRHLQLICPSSATAPLVVEYAEREADCDVLKCPAPLATALGGVVSPTLLAQSIAFTNQTGLVVWLLPLAQATGMNGGVTNAGAPTPIDVSAYAIVALEARLSAPWTPSAYGISPFIEACDVGSNPVAGLSLENDLPTGMGNKQTLTTEVMGCLLEMGRDLPTASGIQVGTAAGDNPYGFDTSDAYWTFAMSMGTRARTVRAGYFTYGNPPQNRTVTLSLWGYP